MSDTGTTPPLPSSSQPPLDRELLTFIREENEANRRSTREDAQANRDTLLGTLKIISYPLAAVLAIAGILGWRSLSDLKASIQAEARAESKAEIGRMQEEIRHTLEDQFKTPTIQKMVEDAATSQTQSVLHPLITQEVTTAVKRGVDAEQPVIQATVVKETRTAVDNLKPTLDGIVTSHVNATVDKAVAAQIAEKITPVVKELNDLKENQKLWVLTQEQIDTLRKSIKEIML